MTTSSEILAASYLRAAPDTFWEWSRDGSELNWKGGFILTFRKEVAAILERLSPEGLPPFGAMLLILAATRDRWESNAKASRDQLLDLLPNVNELPLGRWEPLLDEVIGELTRISRLPKELRHDSAAKARIVEVAINPSARSVPANESAAVVDHLRPGLAAFLQNPSIDPTNGYGAQRLVSDLKLLSEGLAYVTEQVLRDRASTSLDELPDAVELDDPLPAPEAARRLIDELRDDLEWAGLARTAGRLISAVSLPRSLADHDDDQAGGLSDISNRGSLDRLLLSELAHDGLTLAVRVAMNEALYLRREAPPRQPIAERAIFIDVGLRSWGLPRLYSTSLALAFTAAADMGRPVSTFGAHGGSLVDIDLTNREGLVAHLAWLESDLSPADALRPFVDRLRDAEHPVEPVLIISPETFVDSEFDATCRQTVSRLAGVRSVVLATCNRHGEIKVIQRMPAGDTLLRELVVAPSDITARGNQLVDESRNRSDLPAIFAQRVFPLQLPHPVKADRTWYCDGFGVHSLTGDGRLMRWTTSGEGAYQVNDAIPKGSLKWASPGPTNGRLSIVIAGDRDCYLIHIGQNDFLVEMHKIQWSPVYPPAGIGSHGGVLYLIESANQIVHVCSREDGSKIDTCNFPIGFTWQRDRFFRNASGQYAAIAFDGEQARFVDIPVAEPTAGHQSVNQRDWIAVFEQFGREGVYALTESGTLVDHSSGTERRLSDEYRPAGNRSFYRISPDGLRMTVQDAELRFRTYQVAGCDSTLIDKNRLPDVIEDRAQALIRHRSVRHRFANLGVNAENDLVLTSYKGARWAICYSGGHISLKRESERLSPVGVKRFEPMSHPYARYRLQEAQFPNGNRAILDSRGLLHLVPADPHALEATVVLVDGELAGWCSDGTLWGNRFYAGQFGDRSLGTCRRIWTTILQPFAEAIRD